MGPLRRRTWAPRGRTPRLLQRARSRRKVSVIGALVISPRRHRVRAYFGVLPEANYDGDAILAFLKQLRRTLRAPIFMVGSRVVVLHAVIKKSQQTPDRELKLARKRLKELQDG